jgi:hypothetical protein
MQIFDNIMNDYNQTNNFYLIFYVGISATLFSTIVYYVDYTKLIDLQVM